MKAETLFRELERRGAVLAEREGQLVVDAPKGVLTDELRAAIRESKADLLALCRWSQRSDLAEREALTALADSVGVRMGQLQQFLGTYRQWVAWRDELLADDSRLADELKQRGLRLEDVGWTVGRDCRWRRLTEREEETTHG